MLPVTPSKQALLEREMRTLRVVVRLLSALFLAVAARSLIDGLSVTRGVCAALVATLLLIGAALIRRGRLEIACRP
jgi:hypothetical protein